MAYWRFRRGLIGALSVCTLAALFSRVGARCVDTNQTLGSKRPLDTTRGRCCYATVLVHRAKLRIYCAFLIMTVKTDKIKLLYSTVPEEFLCQFLPTKHHILILFFNSWASFKHSRLMRRYWFHVNNYHIRRSYRISTFLYPMSQKNRFLGMCLSIVSASMDTIPFDRIIGLIVLINLY